MVGRIHTHLGRASGDRQVQPIAAEEDRHPQRAKTFRPHRVEDQPVRADLQPGETALQQVDASGHGGDVNPLCRGPALDVGDIGHQDLLEVTHGSLAVAAGEHPGVHHPGQCRTVRGPVQVVVHGSGNLFRGEPIAQPGEQLPQFVGGEQVEQHQHVGLFGGLVAVDVVVVRLQDAVQALDVAVPLAQSGPVQLGQVAVTLELTDHTATGRWAGSGCGVERHEHPAADVVPLIQFAAMDTQAFEQIQSIPERHRVQGVEGPHDRPHRHHVGIGVVVDPVIGAVGVAGVELVGTDHAADDVAALTFVELGPADPEPGDFGEHLRAVLDEVFQVSGHLVVLPDVVGHGDADVVCAGAGVRVPPAGVGVEVEGLALLPAVAAGLPGEHRTGPTGLAGRPPRLRQSPVAIAQQRTGGGRRTQIQHREHEQLIPEDVPAVGLAVQTAGRHPGVEVHRTIGHGLQQMQQVQSNHPHRVRVLIEGDVEPLPQV